MITHEIDYLQYNCPLSEKICIAQNHEKINPLPFYRRGYEDELGIRRYFENPNSKKALIVISGKAMSNQRAVGWSDRQIVSDAIRANGRVTRIDLAVTHFIDEFLVTPDDVAKLFWLQMIDSPLVKYGAKTISSVGENYQDGIETLYIGDMKKRGKRGIFRCYDKGLELDLGKHLITRLEYEDRGDTALTTAKRIADGKPIGSVFRTRFNCECNLFDRLMQAPTIDTTRGIELQKSDSAEDHEKRKRWLLKQVAPALEKVLEREQEFLLRFLKAANVKLD